MNPHTNEEIRDLLSREGFGDRVFLTGSDFSFPSEIYIADLGARFWWFLSDLGINYRHEGFDCTKYTRIAIAHAILDHWKSGLETTLAVGEACIVSDLGPHSAFGAILSDQGRLFVNIYEPQPQNRTCLKLIDRSRIGSRVFWSS